MRSQKCGLCQSSGEGGGVSVAAKHGALKDTEVAWCVMQRWYVFENAVEAYIGVS